MECVRHGATGALSAAGKRFVAQNKHVTSMPNLARLCRDVNNRQKEGIDEEEQLIHSVPGIKLVQQVLNAPPAPIDWHEESAHVL